MIEFLERKAAPDLAYIKYEGKAELPTVMFLGGFASDMMGTKASFLEEQCKARGQSYIRFDYSGHGQSKGQLEEGCVSHWTQDATHILDECTHGPVILIGSSMGGWISLLLARSRAERVGALVGIAAAPDFTTWIEKDMNDEQRIDLEQDGFFKLPSDYDAPYIITKKLINDGRHNFLLNDPIKLDLPIRLLQGKKDKDVPWKTAELMKDKITGSDVEIFYREDGTHSLSSSDDLTLLDDVLKKLSGL